MKSDAKAKANGVWMEMKKRTWRWGLLAIAGGMFLISSLPVHPQSPPTPLPTVVAGDLPLYPLLLQSMGLQGTVTFCVRTDGERVVSVVAEEGPLGLRQLCAAYPASWVFKKHAPTEFRVSLHYGLQHCCDDCPPPNGTLLMNLPSLARINAPSICMTSVKLGPDGKPIIHWPILPYLPTIRSAKLLLYPEEARDNGVEGLVSLRVATDGERVEAVTVEGGPPLLASASVAFVKSWQLEPHIPISFLLTIRFRLLDCPECPAHGTIRMALPKEVEIVAPQAPR